MELQSCQASASPTLVQFYTASHNIPFSKISIGNGEAQKEQEE